MNGLIEHLGDKPRATLSIHRYEKSRFPSYYLWPPPVKVKVSSLLLGSCSDMKYCGWLLRKIEVTKNYFWKLL